MHPAITLDRPSESSSVTLVRHMVGNATKETDLSVTFKLEKSKLNDENTLPFQVYYTNMHSDKIFFILIPFPPPPPPSGSDPLLP